MDYYNESLNNSETRKIKSKGIKKIVYAIKDIDGDNAFVDTTNLQYRNDNQYMNSLIKVTSKMINYKNKVIQIPVDEYAIGRIMDVKNPLGCICRYMKSTPLEFKTNFKGFTFIFYNSRDNRNFYLYVDQYQGKEFDSFIRLLEELSSHTTSFGLTGSTKTGDKSPVVDKVDTTAEKKKEVESKKKQVVAKVASVADIADSEEEALDILDQDEDFKQLLLDLEEEDSNKPNFNRARTSRISKVNDEFMKKQIRGRTVRDMIENPRHVEEIPKDNLKVASIEQNQKDWEEVRFTNFQKCYDLESDIVRILESLGTKDYPVSVLDIKVEDTSTNMDLVDTYTVKIEDGFGKRSTLVFDIPKFKNNRFMLLRGNEKVMSGQLMLLPVQKTDEDTVQCVSNYNKIFLYRKGLVGKSYPYSDRILKVLKKLSDKSKIKVTPGDNTTICSKYELPIDYIDIASAVSRIDTPDKIYYFNQDEYNKFNVDRTKGLPFAIDKKTGEIDYYNIKELFSSVFAKILCAADSEFDEIYKSTKPAARLSYTEASILAQRIPLAIVLGYSLGLTKLFKIVSVDLEEEIPPDKPKDNYGRIKFNDGNYYYKIKSSSSLILNGLSMCRTEDFSKADIDKRSMWLTFLEDFGGVLISDGLDNFAELFMDPITKEVCEHCKLPSDYFELLVYASNLLSDNKYTKHTDIGGNRYRTNELVAGYFYKAISKAYTEYKQQVKRGRKVALSMKKSAVIDALLADPTLTDLSTLNPLLEMKAANNVSFKGLSGMNGARAYNLDKRAYDDSMVNSLAMSTGFSANVGVDRQATIDMNVEGTRGYIKNANKDDMSTVKSLCMTEAMTPFGTTRDDPFRTAMTYIQTSDHNMQTTKSSPLLITNGADEALPYLTSETYTYRAKENGKVISIDDNMMLIEYDTNIIPIDGDPYNHEYVDLSERVRKNSAGGFFITIKLDTDLKVGSKFKKGDILAYDKKSYSKKIGESGNLAYNLGVLSKVAILATDEGFEDSTSVSNWISEAMATDVVVEKDKDLSPKTNVYHMVEVGQQVQQGDPLIIFQNSFEEEDANLLLKNITDPEYVSDLGRIKIKSKYTGVIQDIKIYRTCEIDELSDSLKKIVTKYEKKIKEQKAIYKKYNIPGENTLEPDHAIEATGIMKNNRNGVKIVFYIKYADKMSVGDKLVAQSANKGVIKDIFPENHEPYSEFRPDEKIHAVFSSTSFNSRMVTSVWISGAINKVMIELDRAVKDIMGIKWDINDIENL